MKIIKEQSTNGEKFLFGAGGAASWVLQGFVREGILINGFIDDAADRIRTVSNLPVHAPNSAHIPIGQRKKSTVIFAVMNPTVNESATRDRLLGLGWG